MRNRLQKKPEVVYTPAVPARAPQAEYRYTITVRSSARSGGGGGFQSHTGVDRNIASPTYGQTITHTTWVGPTGGSSRPVMVKRTIIVPAVPGIPGVPARADYYANNGWNGGAHSIAKIPANAYVEVSLPRMPAAILVGLSSGPFRSEYGDIDIGMVARSSGITPVAGGVDLDAEGAAGTRLRIERSPLGIRMLVDGSQVYHSASDLTGDVYLGAMLYGMSDYVYDPVIGTVSAPGKSFASVGQSASLRMDPRGTALVGIKTVGLASIDGRFLVRGQASVGQRAAGSAAARHSSSGNVAQGAQAAALGYGLYNTDSPITHGVGSFVSGKIGLRLYTTTSSNASRVAGNVPPLRLVARAGRPEVMLTQVAGRVPPVLLQAHAVTGEVGRVDGEIRVVGKVADGPYCGVDSVAAIGYQLVSYESYLPDGVLDAGEPVIAWDSISMSAAVLFILHEGVNIGSEIDLFLMLDLSMYEMVGLDDTLSLAGTIELIMREGVSIADSVERARAEALQYAVNAVTGALSRYRGFGFKQFATVDGRTYAITDTGLFKLEGSTDNGAPLSASIDFGASDYGSAQRKRVSSVYAGIATDGDVYLRITGDDGEERIYRARSGDNERRVLTAKGIAARHWRVRLELVDAEYADLDNMEIEVGVSQRRVRR